MATELQSSWQGTNIIMSKTKANKKKIDGNVDD